MEVGENPSQAVIASATSQCHQRDTVDDVSCHIPRIEVGLLMRLGIGLLCWAQ